MEATFTKGELAAFDLLNDWEWGICEACGDREELTLAGSHKFCRYCISDIHPGYLKEMLADAAHN